MGGVGRTGAGPGPARIDRPGDDAATPPPDETPGDAGPAPPAVARNRPGTAGAINEALVLARLRDLEESGTVGEVPARGADAGRLATATVEAAKALAAGKHEYGIVYETEETKKAGVKEMSANLRYFVYQEGIYWAHGDVEQASALRDIFADPGKYRFECMSAMQIVQYRALLDVMGEERFNKTFAGGFVVDSGATLTAPGAGDPPTWQSFVSEEGSPEVEAGPGALERLRPGDWVYFRNWDVSREAMDRGLQGENAIHLGAGRFYIHSTHGDEIVRAEEIVSRLNAARKEGSTRSASLTTQVRRLDPEKVAATVPGGAADR